MATLCRGSVIRLLSGQGRLLTPAACKLSDKTPSGAKPTPTPKAAATPPPPPPPPPAQSTAPSTDGTTYETKEYYSYNEMSFYDIDCDMSPYRIPQPSKYAAKTP